MAKQKPIPFVHILSGLTALLARNDVGNDIRKEIDVTQKEWNRFLDDYDKEPLPTVNVIELIDTEVHSVRSFLANPNGTAAAHALFKELYIEHNDPDGTTGEEKPTDEEFVELIKDGYDDSFGYQLLVKDSDE